MLSELAKLLDSASWWEVLAFWVSAGGSAGLFAILVPRMRSALTRLSPPMTPDPALRVVGAALGTGLDAVKLCEQAERIADALEDIGQSVRSLAKSEEAGTGRMLETIAEKLSRLEHRERG